MTIPDRCEWIEAMEEAWCRGGILELPTLHQHHQSVHRSQKGRELCTARGYYLMGEYGRCIDFLTLPTTETLCQHPSYWELIAKSYARLGHFAKAYGATEKLLSFSPLKEDILSEAYAIKWFVYQARGFPKEARNWALQAVNSDAAVSFSFLSTQAWEECFAQRSETRTLYPNYLHLIVEFLKCSKERDYARGLHVAYEMLKHLPVDPRNYGLLIRLLYLNGRDTEARVAYDKLKQAFYESMIPAMYLCFYGIDYVDESTIIDELIRASEIEPSCGVLHYLIGLLYYWSDRRSIAAFYHAARALELFEKQKDNDIYEYGRCSWYGSRAVLRNKRFFSALRLIWKGIMWGRRVPEELIQTVIEDVGARLITGKILGGR